MWRNFSRRCSGKGCCVWNEWKRLRDLPRARKALLAEALAALALARLAMACLPFRRIAAWLGTPGAESPAEASPAETRMGEEIGWAVGVLGRRVPWDGRCLAQALAATAMLRRRGLEGTVSFGARPGRESPFAAHAWLRVGSSVVTGGAGHQTFQIFTTFARRRT
jgi:transglutaminase-like putative cysteine protease